MIQMLPPPLLNYTLPSASHQASEGQGYRGMSPLVTAMCDRDYIAGEAQMHRKLRCNTG